MKLPEKLHDVRPTRESSPNRSEIEKHQDKLVGYYLSGGDFDYVFSPEDVQTEIDGSERTKRVDVFKMMADNKSGCERLERRLLLSIAGPDRRIGAGGIFEKMKGDKHQKRILATMTGLDWDDYNLASSEDVGIFIRKYPTPMDFETDGRYFLREMKKNNPARKVEEYYEAMDKFCRTVYGKKFEYYEAMKGLHEDAVKWYTERVQSGEARAKNRDLGNRALGIVQSENKNTERIVTDAGMTTLNKGDLIGDATRINEDAAYCNPNLGMFGVFDGAGGEEGAAKASGLAVGTVRRAMMANKLPDTAEELAQVLKRASNTIRDDREAGITTGVVGRVIEKDGEKKLIFATAGDSRIYIVRNGRARQLTVDEGYENVIYNYLGGDNSYVKQMGEVTLKDGDRIVLCSDGVTGDKEKDFIPEREFVDIVSGAETAAEAAQGLVERATKRDDRTAIVAIV